MHKKKKKKGILAGLHLPSADDVVPEDTEEAFTHGLVHPARHKKHHPATLRGFASSMLEKADKQEKAQRKSAAKKAKTKADQIKKQEQDQLELEKAEAKKAGTKVVHLDLSQDDVEPLDEDEDEEKDLPSLGSFMEDDDDDMY